MHPNNISPENQITWEDLKKWVGVVRSLFNPDNYKNTTFFKTVVTVVLVLFAISTVSGIYFSYKIFNFVTGNVSRVFDKVDTELDKASTLDDMSYNIFQGPNDEDIIKDSMEAKEKTEAKKNRREQDLIAAKKLVDWLITASHEEIKANVQSGIPTPPCVTINNKWKSKVCREVYGNSLMAAAEALTCNSTINDWLQNWPKAVEIKALNAEKYKKELAKKLMVDWEPGEKKYKTRYVKNVSRYKKDLSAEQLIALLKEEPPEDLVIEAGRWNNDISYNLDQIKDLKQCIALAEILVPAMLQCKEWFFQGAVPYTRLIRIAETLQIDLPKPNAKKSPATVATEKYIDDILGISSKKPEVMGQ